MNLSQRDYLQFSVIYLFIIVYYSTALMLTLYELCSKQENTALVCEVIIMILVFEFVLLSPLVRHPLSI